MTAGRYVKAVLWDMDGTLMDSQPLWDEAFRRCCRERGGTVTEEHVAGIAGSSPRPAPRPRPRTRLPPRSSPG